jgi:hypothetical protein
MQLRDWAASKGDAVFSNPFTKKRYWSAVDESRATRWVAYLVEIVDGDVKVRGVTSLSRSASEAIENIADMATRRGYEIKGQAAIIAVPVARDE